MLLFGALRGADHDARVGVMFMTVAFAVVWIMGFHFGLLWWESWWLGAKLFTWAVGAGACFVLWYLGKEYVSEGFVGILKGVPLMLVGVFFGLIMGTYFIMIGLAALTLSVGLDLLEWMGDHFR